LTWSQESYAPFDASGNRIRGIGSPTDNWNGGVCGACAIERTVVRDESNTHAYTRTKIVT
jgi:hypothetical protein